MTNKSNPGNDGERDVNHTPACEGAHGHTARHLRITNPSPWVRRFLPLVPKGGRVLDLAAGGGRHARLALDMGYAATLIDRNIEALDDLGEAAEVIEADLEDGGSIFGPSGALSGRTFDGIIVSNYLFRPLLGAIVAAVAPGGVLIYETFAMGNEAYNRPRNPDHLLKPGELLDAVAGALQVVAYEHGLIEKEAAISGVISRIAAVNAETPASVYSKN